MTGNDPLTTRTNCIRRGLARRNRSSLSLLAVLLGGVTAAAFAGDRVESNQPTPPEGLSAAERGYWLLTNKPYLPPDFDQATFDNLWQVWPAEERKAAAQAGPAERRRLTYARYGLIERPESQGDDPALGYLSDGADGWVMNCLACHGGETAGQSYPGSPNSHFAMQTLIEDVTTLKLLQLKPLAHLDKAATGIPLSTTDGTTNSVVFGIILGALRNPDMSVDTNRPIPELVHHDMDPPPFWNVKKKSRLYIDGFAPKTARPLLQFMLIPPNDRETILSWEQDYEDVLAWIESVEPPDYPWEINHELARQGETIFAANCAECHGTYGGDESYPEVTVPISVIGTDPVRLEALTPAHREWMKTGWMSRFGKDEVRLDPGGYVAPPLDGIWASAPYFHNGSVPTLWHVLHPDERPVVWRRSTEGYDRERIGLEVTEFDEVPRSVQAPRDRRRYFDTRLTGKSAAGHLFPNTLSEEDRRAVLEYLKTL